MNDLATTENKHGRLTEQEMIDTLREVAAEDPIFYEFFATMVIDQKSEHHKVCLARLQRRNEKGISGLN